MVKQSELEPDHIFLRRPPQNLEAEMCVLGAILLDNKALMVALDTLDAEDFYRDANRTVFSAMLLMDEQQTAIDAITLKDTLRSLGKLEEVGGTAYIAECAALVPTAGNVAYYARIVRRKAVLRNLISVCTAAVQDGYSDNPDPEFGGETIANAIYELEQLRERFVDHPEQTKVEAIADAVIRMGQRGVMTGLADAKFDANFVGFNAGDITTLAGRTSKGKSAIALCIAANVAGQGHGVAYFTLEMSTSQIWTRLIALNAGLNSFEVAQGENVARVDMAQTSLTQLPIEVLFRRGLRPQQFKRECERLKRKMPLKLAVIDYLGMMRGDRRERDRWREMSDVVQEISNHASELGIAVMIVAQINREGDDDKPPRLSQLRDTGTLEEHSSNVMMIWQPPLDKKQFHTSGGPNEVEIIMAKQRNGPAPFSTRLFFDRSTGRFSAIS